MQTRFIKLLEDRLSLELSTYNNLPFYFAWLYITLNEKNTIFYNSLYIKYRKADNRWNQSDPDADYLIHSFDNNKFSHLELHRTEYYTHPFKSPCYVVSPNWTWKKNQVMDNNNNYVYYRHDRLKNLINTICNQYIQERNNIPFKYVVPYLFFNRDREVTIVTSEGATVFKYDLQNEAIKEKDQYHTNSKYFKIVDHTKLNDYFFSSQNFLYCMCYIK